MIDLKTSTLIGVCTAQFGNNEMTNDDPKVLAVARELNRQDSGGIGTYEWKRYEEGARDPDTMRHVNRYIERAKVAIEAAGK